MRSYEILVKHRSDGLICNLANDCFMDEPTGSKTSRSNQAASKYERFLSLFLPSAEALHGSPEVQLR